MKKLRIGLVTRRELKGWIFLAPWVAGFLGFFLYPIVQSVIYSFHSVKITAIAREMHYVGTYNYGQVFTAANVTKYISFFTSAILQLAVVLVFSLIIAMMLNKPIRGKGFFRTLFFLPVVVVSGPVLSRLVSTGGTSIPFIEAYGITGIITSILPEALATPIAQLFSQLILVLWYSGVPILFYMTGLQKIDDVIYEAALIDGADSWVAFWKITLPAIRQYIMICGVYTIVFLATNSENVIVKDMRGRMYTAGYYGIQSAEAVWYAFFISLIVVAIFLLCRERKGKKVEEVKTMEQMRVARMHAERAKRMTNYKERKERKILGKKH